MATVNDIAKWMLDKVTSEKELFQIEAADEIQSKFGSDYVYENERGNLAISKAVLKEFRKLSEDTVVWERGLRYWRLRDPSDTPGRRQADY